MAETRVQRYACGPRKGEVRRENHGRPLRDRMPGTEKHYHRRHEPLISAKGHHPCSAPDAAEARPAYERHPTARWRDGAGSSDDHAGLGGRVVPKARSRAAIAATGVAAAHLVAIRIDGDGPGQTDERPRRCDRSARRWGRCGSCPARSRCCSSRRSTTCWAGRSWPHGPLRPDPHVRRDVGVGAGRVQLKVHPRRHRWPAGGSVATPCGRFW